MYQCSLTAAGADDDLMLLYHLDRVEAVPHCEAAQVLVVAVGGMFTAETICLGQFAKVAPQHSS